MRSSRTPFHGGENALHHHDVRTPGATLRREKLSPLKGWNVVARGLRSSAKNRRPGPARLHDVGQRFRPLTHLGLGVTVLAVSQAASLTSRRHVDLRRHASAFCRTGR
ncbi:putative leader peptide [Lentzea sp. NPDC003310]|uniref:putative leader peptide n=1 Tax=Lentzea sp. NPDC003310 TaxID=3154447 RepID=UPI00339F3C99